MTGRAKRGLAITSAAILLAAMSGCGGGGAGSAGPPGPVATGTPTPSPSPTPTPTPVAFEPVEAQLFSDNLYNSSLVVGGHGWIVELTPPVTSVPFDKVTAADNLSVVYDAGANAYRVSGPLVGGGTLFQVSARQSNGGFITTVAADRASAEGHAQFMLIPGGATQKAKYIAELYADYGPESLEQYLFGTFAVAQPTNPAETPVAGTAIYDGKLAGNFAQDAGGTGLEANATFEFDFGKSSISSSFVPNVLCMMGCGYPTQGTYTLANVHKTGAGTFTGEITTPGAPSAGSFTAVLAGPNAAELLVTVSFPYMNPEYGSWMNFGGYFIAKKSP